jgi:hypothetical protein
MAVVAALTYSIAGNHMLTSGPNDFVGRLRIDFVPATRCLSWLRHLKTWISQRALNITLKASVAFGLLAA